MQYDWPGNVRELRNIIERALVLCKGKKIKPSELVFPEVQQSVSLQVDIDEAGLAPLEEIERRHIQHVFESCSRNLAKSATILSVSESTLRRKLKSYNVIP